MKIDKCLNCDSKNLYDLSEKNNDDSKGFGFAFLCMDCRELHELDHKAVDSLSWYLWNREYNKYKKKRRRI